MFSGFKSELYLNYKKMGKREFKDYICSPFCRFFQEGKREEMACQGAIVVERLIKRGLLDHKMIPSGSKRASLWEKFDPVLHKCVCDKCHYMEKDCDFHAIFIVKDLRSICPNKPICGLRSISTPIEVEPCGGYILLRLLQLKGIIDRERLDLIKDDE